MYNQQLTKRSVSSTDKGLSDITCNENVRTQIYNFDRRNNLYRVISPSHSKI